MNKAWWKESVVYQIYPRSFCDGNGDGVGDLRGIISKLDYLQELGIDVVWLSPVYKSPNDDNGYDISDYRAIMDEFGTMADFDEMLTGMHQRGIKLMMDLVVNHTSDEHAWFREARQSRDNPYHDFYIWRDPVDGREPNNWESFFSGSTWQYNEATGEYYLHLFSKKQPDLNWENPKVRAEVYDMMHFWFTKGIDGFRMDVINLISKTPGLPDGPVLHEGFLQSGFIHYANGPRLLEFLREMRREVLSHYDCITVGETPGVTTSQGIEITNEETGALNMLFQFEHMDLDSMPGDPFGKWALKPLDLRDLKQTMSRWQVDLAGKGWNSLYLSNHDQPRPVSRFGDDGAYRVESAKMLGAFLHLQQGTPYVYQGEELGMTNVRFTNIDEYRDIETLNMYREAVELQGRNPADIMNSIHAKGRDNARTPMQWDAGENAGFTTGTPWIKVNPNYTTLNAEQARADPNSVFHFYQRLIRLRKDNPVVVYGRYDLLLPDHPRIYAFTRTLDNDRLLVILNFSAEMPVFELPGSVSFGGKDLLISNYAVDPANDIRRLVLRPYEARVYRLQ